MDRELNYLFCAIESASTHKNPLSYGRRLTCKTWAATVSQFCHHGSKQSETCSSHQYNLVENIWCGTPATEALDLDYLETTPSLHLSPRRSSEVFVDCFRRWIGTNLHPCYFTLIFTLFFKGLRVHFQNGLPPKPLWCSRHFYRLGCYPLVYRHEPSALEVAKLWHKFVAVLHQVHSLFKTSHPNFLYSCDEWIGKKSTAEGPASVWNVNSGEPIWIDENSQPRSLKVGTNIQRKPLIPSIPYPASFIPLYHSELSQIQWFSGLYQVYISPNLLRGIFAFGGYVLIARWNK